LSFFLSTKFTTEQRQLRITSGDYVLLRFVMDGGTYTVMTATAAEDDGTFSPYPQQDLLIQAAQEAFSPIGGPAQNKEDASSRAYVEFSGIDDPRQIRHAADRVAAALGLDATSDPWADEELRDIWEDLAIHDGDDPVYLSDGRSLTRDGNLVRG
jgi:hypothetical protein